MLIRRAKKVCRPGGNVRVAVTANCRSGIITYARARADEFRASLGVAERGTATFRESLLIGISAEFSRLNETMKRQMAADRASNGEREMRL